MQSRPKEMSPRSMMAVSVLMIAGAVIGEWRIWASDDRAAVSGTAKVTSCSTLGGGKGTPSIAITLDGPPHEVRYDQPKEFFLGVRGICTPGVSISFTAVPAKNAFGEALWLRSLENVDAHSIVFSEADYAAWVSSNNRIGTIMLGFLGLFGALGVWAASKRLRE